MAAYDVVLEQDPQYRNGYSARGHAHLGEGELGAAEADYRRAVALQPQSPSELNNLCHVLHRQWRRNEAVSMCRKALEFGSPTQNDSKTQSLLWYNLGVALSLDGGAQLEEAITSFQRALAMQPGWIAAQTALEDAISHRPYSTRAPSQIISAATLKNIV